MKNLKFSCKGFKLISLHTINSKYAGGFLDAHILENGKKKPVDDWSGETLGYSKICRVDVFELTKALNGGILEIVEPTGRMHYSRLVVKA